jgi:hypothetical protein
MPRIQRIAGFIATSYFAAVLFDDVGALLAQRDQPAAGVRLIIFKFKSHNGELYLLQLQATLTKRIAWLGSA